MNSVGLYIRLSKADKEKDKFNNSESVDNQISLLKKYCNEFKYDIYDIYIDDGFTGTNFNRPSFNRLINDIENKKVDMVIVKDLSRLGRDYILTGYYLEMWFPNHNVRFVSILDNIDSLYNNNDIAPFKSIINDMYSKDNSKKIKAALRIKQQMGKWVGGCTPFGYKTDIFDKNHLVINEEEACIVRKIYSLFLSGFSINKISDYLYNQNILPPVVFRNINKQTKYSKYGYWSSTTIKTILTNELYTGDLVQNRRSRINYKIRKLKNNDKNDWIVIKNTHEAIIDKEKFNEVQRLLKLNRSIRMNNKHERLLTGLLFCYDCKKRMSIEKNYIVCNTYKKYSKLGLCTSHYCNYSKVENEIINKIKKIIIENETNLKEKIIKKYNNINYDWKIKKINNKLDRLYIDKLDKKISDEMYDRLYSYFVNDINNLKCFKKCNLDKLFNYFINNIDRAMIINMVDKIEIHNNKIVDIYFNFKNKKIITND